VEEDIGDDVGMGMSATVIQSEGSAGETNDSTAAFRDPQFYLNYEAPDADTERGYAMPARGDGHFNDALAAVTVDLVADDPSERRAKGKGKLVWDKTKKNFVRDTLGSDNVKRIKTESGQRVPASFKTNLWVQRPGFMLHWGKSR
jgi:hypothetical protein